MTSTLTNALFSKGALVDLDISRWAGTKRLQEEDLLLGHVNKDAVYLGHKKLLPKSSLSKVIEKEQKARNSVLKLTSKFPVSGTRFATFIMLPQIVEDLEKIKIEWEIALKDFLNEYEVYKAKQIETLIQFYHDRIYEELQKTVLDKREEKLVELTSWAENKKHEIFEWYPSTDILETKFSFTWRIFKIEPIDGKMEVKALAEAQNKLEADLKTWVKDASAEMHKTLGEAAVHAQYLLEKQGKLNAKNLKPLFDAFEVFTNMDFVGSSFKNTIDAIKTNYMAFDSKGLETTIDWKTTSDLVDSHKDAFKTLLEGMVPLAIDSMAEHAGISTVVESAEFKRFVEL